MQKFTSKRQKIGKTGENLAIKYLVSKGFMIICLNYTEKCGEIDIVAINSTQLHFIEVKSVSCEIDNTENTYRPEENLSQIKYRKIAKTVEMFLVKHHEYADFDWQIDLACVYLDYKRRTGRVKFLRNIGFN